MLPRTVSVLKRRPDGHATATPGPHPSTLRITNPTIATAKTCSSDHAGTITGTNFVSTTMAAKITASHAIGPATPSRAPFGPVHSRAPGHSRTVAAVTISANTATMIASVPSVETDCSRVSSRTPATIAAPAVTPAPLNLPRRGGASRPWGTSALSTRLARAGSPERASRAESVTVNGSSSVWARATRAGHARMG